jgi:hypothetical protein
MSRKQDRLLVMGLRDHQRWWCVLVVAPRDLRCRVRRQQAGAGRAAQCRQNR